MIAAGALLQRVCKHTLCPSYTRACLCHACLPGPLQAQPFSGLTFSNFAAALAMCGLAAFGAKRARAASTALRQPEQQLAAFFSFLGLPLPPGQERLMLHAAAAPPHSVMAGVRASCIAGWQLVHVRFRPRTPSCTRFCSRPPAVPAPQASAAPRCRRPRRRLIRTTSGGAWSLTLLLRAVRETRGPH